MGEKKLSQNSFLNKQTFQYPATLPDFLQRALQWRSVDFHLKGNTKKIYIQVTPNAAYCGFYNANEEIASLLGWQRTPWTDALTSVKRILTVKSISSVDQRAKS